MQIHPTLCFPQTEPPPSSDSKSKQHRSHGSCVECFSINVTLRWMCTLCCSHVNHCGVVLCRYAVAESDCNLAIALDSNYFKAYARRGAARFALEKCESALEGDKLLKEF